MRTCYPVAHLLLIFQISYSGTYFSFYYFKSNEFCVTMHIIKYLMFLLCNSVDITM